MSKEVMQQALEALENTTPTGFNMESDKRFYAAITALREALAEQPAQQEPVAWGCNRYIEDDNGFRIGTDDPELAWGKLAPDDNGWWPLYTSPPAQRILELEALLERQTARIVDLQTHIENLEGEDR